MGGRVTEERVLGFAEALGVVLRHAAGVRAPGVERVTLPDSAGRVLAKEVRADRDQPPFDRATRDGFAVRAEEWTGGRRLRVVGQVRAGGAWDGREMGSGANQSGADQSGTDRYGANGRGRMQPGAAIEIMTGAAVPEGADAVAMVEHVELGEGAVWAAAGRGLRAGENIVRRGSEARQGVVLLAAGTAMGAAEIAVAAACGRAELAVRERPVVAIVTTGDELVEVEEAPGEHQIRNSNGYALAAMVQAAGGRARRMAIARDSREEVRARIAEGRGSELLLLSGGVSVGKYDLVEEVLEEFGAEFFFTGVRMQPGRPVVFGRLPRDGKRQERTTEILSVAQNDGRSVDGERDRAAREWTYFFGLPGNPVSTQVTFHCFAQPMLRALCGAGVSGPRFVQATLVEEVGGKAGLTRFLPAILRHDLERPSVEMVRTQGSGDLAANARANCYAVLPEGRDCKAGDVVSVLLR